MDVVNYSLLHRRQVALPGYPLISLTHSYSILRREFDDHMIGGRDGPYSVERGSSQ